MGYAKEKLRALGFDGVTDTPVPIICLSHKNLELCQIQQRLLDRGLLVQFVSSDSYSGVPSGRVIRIAIFATHRIDQIDFLSSQIESLLG